MPSLADLISLINVTVGADGRVPAYDAAALGKFSLRQLSINDLSDGNFAGAQVNNYGVRELNPFSAPKTVLDTDNEPFSDRAGFLFLFSENYQEWCLAMLADPTVTIINQSSGNLFTSVFNTPNKLNITFDGIREWRIQNLTGVDVNLYPCVTSMSIQLP